MAEPGDGDPSSDAPEPAFEGNSSSAAGDDTLAVLVEQSRTESVIETLQATGNYDDSRRVRQFGDGTVAVPVLEVPSDLRFRDVVRQEGARKLRTLEDHLAASGWTDEELLHAPGSWAVIGGILLVEVGDAPRPEEVGEALLELHANAHTVLARGGIDGEQREPDVSVLAGDGDTETIHTEHGTRYALDLSEVMFSPGNKAERARMGEIVTEGERVFDMFAGIGYFTLPMARGGAHVTATEINPTAFRYLLENAKLNEVHDRVDLYRADCRDVAETVSADRVVMGYYEAHEYLDSALAALEPGGVLHMHEATPNDLVPDRPVDRLETAGADAGRSVEIIATRRVKSYSEGVAHVVVDARSE